MRLSALALERSLVCFAAMLLVIPMVQAAPVAGRGPTKVRSPRSRFSDFLCDFVPFGGADPLGGVEGKVRQHDTSSSGFFC
ncbi:hypothetical protein PsYK624_119060 [Phanerochaete sordida]|uniref:Secreted protein n=1 Tax=Phanerochaete sordida TaxID=48140 RepID=A0A9P3GII1_9APHY|nr:hypothetical protein PsYK624_119060 [Phanerochaete sordida]